jgi:hypothetical protein
MTRAAAIALMLISLSACASSSSPSSPSSNATIEMSTLAALVRPSSSGNTYDIQFTLINHGSETVTLENALVTITRGDSSTGVFGLGLAPNTTLTANESRLFGPFHSVDAAGRPVATSLTVEQKFLTSKGESSVSKSTTLGGSM